MKIRIAVAVDRQDPKRWNVAGWGKGAEAEMMDTAAEILDVVDCDKYWVEVDLPDFVPIPVLQGTATSESTPK